MERIHRGKFAIDFSDDMYYYFIRETVGELPYWVSVKRYKHPPNDEVTMMKIQRYMDGGDVEEYYRLLLPITTNKMKVGFTDRISRDSELVEDTMPTLEEAATSTPYHDFR